MTSERPLHVGFSDLLVTLLSKYGKLTRTHTGDGALDPAAVILVGHQNSTYRGDPAATSERSLCVGFDDLLVTLLSKYAFFSFFSYDTAITAYLDHYSQSIPQHNDDSLS